MKKSTLIGIAGGLLLTYGAIFMGSGWQKFFDVPSLVLVIGGTVAALVVNYSFDELAQLPGRFKDFLAFETPDLREKLDTMVELSRLARREGLLALDNKMSEIDDEMTCYGLELAVDGIGPDEIDKLLRQYIREEAGSKKLLNKIMNSAGTFAPAFGMVGTLIGLIQMLQNLDDPTQIGAGMSTAMVTTFYGALLANLIFLPLASKAKTQMTLTVKKRELARSAILSIVHGDSPSMVERRLFLYLQDEEDAAERASDEGDGDEEESHLSRAA